MSDLPIVAVPNPKLKHKARKVTDFGPDLRKLADQMIETMRANNGMGLAAPQVDQPIRMITLEYEPDQRNESRIPLTVLVNPTITDTNKVTDSLDEGCLSIPGVEVPVARPTQISVLAQDLDGKKVKVRAKDLHARILQHEIDHLNGTLMIYRAYPNLKQLAGLRVIFMGTPAHVISYISGLAATDMEIVGIITETDKPVGRSKKLMPTPVSRFAKILQLPVFKFETLKDKTAKAAFKALKPDLVIVAAYGKIIPQSLLDIPKHGFLNIHYSLLPVLRGPSPHQTAILRGLPETGYTIFKLDAKVDTGDILVQEKVAIDPSDTSQTLLERMAVLSSATLLEVLPSYIDQTRKLKPQDHSKATHTRLFTKEDGKIDWNQPIKLIDQQIRAMQPWPSAYTDSLGDRLIIHKAHIENDKLVIEVVQPAGKQPMSFKDYLRGNQKNRLTFFEKLGKVKFN